MSSDQGWSFVSCSLENLWKYLYQQSHGKLNRMRWCPPTSFPSSSNQYKLKFLLLSEKNSWEVKWTPLTGWGRFWPSLPVTETESLPMLCWVDWCRSEVAPSCSRDWSDEVFAAHDMPAPQRWPVTCQVPHHCPQCSLIWFCLTDRRVYFSFTLKTTDRAG